MGAAVGGTIGSVGSAIWGDIEDLFQEGSLMYQFQLAVGIVVIALALFSLIGCVVRASRNAPLDGTQFVVAANFGLGLFLVGHALSWDGAFGGVILICSAVIGFASGIVLIFRLIRSQLKDPFR
ncbi:hypothetical protein [Actinomadura napierensis]|uniref:hypothetical protein n=1 Tax=Actinomadura napierensis TaxID=267854 RepID=UPI0031D8775E